MEQKVNALKKEIYKSNGFKLPLSKVHDCTYKLGKRKILLNMIGGELQVLMGGGWQNFEEFLSRTQIKL